MRLGRFYSLLLLAVLFASTSLSATEYEEGVHYQKIELNSSRYFEGKIEVAAFYAYGDPDSFALESHLSRWLKSTPTEVYFIRRPSVKTQKDWALALSYIRAEMLGKGDEVHAALFKALNQTPPGLSSMEALVKFNGEQAINGNLPVHILQVNFKRLSSEWANNAIPAAPSIIVGQKYLVTKEMAGSDEAVIIIVEKLIDKIRRENRK